MVSGGFAYAAAVFLNAAPLAGQGATGTILGTVTDMSGAFLPQAAIQVRNAGTSAAQTVASDSPGRYRNVGYQGSGTPRPDYVGGCDLASGTFTWARVQYQARTPARWFNPNCFSVPAVGTLGNTARDTGRGPGYFSSDFGLVKDTRITETVRTQFRAEFFNISTTPISPCPPTRVFSLPGQRASARLQAWVWRSQFHRRCNY
jgi:hypothetical protein